MMKKLSVALLLIMLLFTSSFRVYAEGYADYGFTISEEESQAKEKLDAAKQKLTDAQKKQSEAEATLKEKEDAYGGS